MLLRKDIGMLALMLASATGLSQTTVPKRPTSPRSTRPRNFITDEFKVALSPELLKVALSPELAAGQACINAPAVVVDEPPARVVDASEQEEDTSLAWQALLMGITACWGANFAVTAYALEALGGGAADSQLFIAARFVLAAACLTPFLATASSAGVVRAGASVGGLCALGYAAQALALGMGTSPGTAAFICSLQSVVVALMAARAAGVAPQTWMAVGLSVAGVGCLELPSALAASAGTGVGPCLGDLVAFGQPIGFGLSYVVLGKAMEEHPEDELPLAALQCAVIAAAAVGSAAVGAHAAPWELHWDHLLPSADAAGDAAWGVPAAIAYTGLISTALTIWLTAKVFKQIPSTDASIILASEPLWATGFAAMLLHEPLTGSVAAGGVLILSALACNEGAFDALLPEQLRAQSEE